MNKQTSFLHLAMVLGIILTASPADAAGLSPDRLNKIILLGNFAAAEPDFLLICSARPLKDAQGLLLTNMSTTALGELRSSADQVVIKLHGKPTAQGYLDYFFGTCGDANKPWNNGKEFRWEDWADHSPDIWDNVCLAAYPPMPGEPPANTIIKDVTILLGGQKLLDTSLVESATNKKPIQGAMEPINLTPQNGTQPLLNLSERMAQFRTDYYELGQNPILQLAYSDLGQTDGRKYTRMNVWCSEFASYIYRECGTPTPDPTEADLYWGNMRKFFEQHGHVYPMSEVATWSNEKKLALIKPGSFVSAANINTTTHTIGATHSMIFTTWAFDGDKTYWACISGNSKGMVRAQASLPLLSPDDTAQMSAEQQEDLDRKVYFAVLP